MSPISSPAPDTAIGVLIPTAPASDTPAEAIEGTSLPNTNWLLTWLGEAAPPAEGEEAPAAEPVPATIATQGHWLSLLPSVPAYYNLFAPVADTPDGEAGQTQSTLPVDGLPLNDAAAFDEPEKDSESTIESNSVPPVVTPLPAPAAGKDESATPDTPLPSATLPISPVQPTLQTPDAPAELARPLPSEGISRVTSATEEISRPQPLVPRQDKGEVIWSAELVVRDHAPKQGSTGEPPITVASGDTEAPVRAEEGQGQEVPAFDKPVAASASRNPQDLAVTHASRGDSGDTASDHRRDANAQSRQSANAAPDGAPVDKTSPAKREEPVSREKPQIPVEATAPAVHPSAARTAITVENRSASPAVEPAATTAAVGSVDLESAKPLRPSQIATLFVDVPQTGETGTASSMRLAVTQRGDQVNVQLRSWDSGVTPIDNDRMQPLLQSLAEQGMSGSKHPLDRMDEYGSNPVENVREKTRATADAASSNNDNNAFQNTEDRQQKNQERQQQQALFLRKQMRTAQTAEFDSQSVLGVPGNSPQQGASR